MSGARLCAGLASTLRRDEVRAIAIPKSPEDRVPREALVLLDEAGVVRAYLNRCRHLPIPIDAGSGQFLDHEGEYLMCGTHGALYRRDNGVCVLGPCRGKALEPFEIEIDGDGVIWIDVD